MKIYKIYSCIKTLAGSRYKRSGWISASCLVEGSGIARAEDEGGEGGEPTLSGWVMYLEREREREKQRCIYKREEEGHQERKKDNNAKRETKNNQASTQQGNKVNGARRKRESRERETDRERQSGRWI